LRVDRRETKYLRLRLVHRLIKLLTSGGVREERDIERDMQKKTNLLFSYLCLNKVSDVVWQLLNTGLVVLLNVSKDSVILVGDKVDCNSLSSEST
jgi:hypothetical protein